MAKWMGLKTGEMPSLEAAASEWYLVPELVFDSYAVGDDQECYLD